MSIINDALKKTQNKMNGKKENISDIYKKMAQNHVPDDQHATHPGQTPIQKEKKRNVLPIVCAIILLVGLATGASVFYFQDFKEKIGLNQEKKINSPKSYRPKPLAKINPSNDALILNGTMVMEDQTVALINNEIYQLGDVVNGRKIIDIQTKKVELLEGEQIISIQTKDY